jgi:hypothetical protein
MKGDLLGAQITLDWAIAQIDIIRSRIFDWRDSRPYVAVPEADAKPGYDLIKAHVTSEMPPIINAEAGAILNMLRSSLDILAVALAERNGHVRPKDTYFPIAASTDAFFKGADGRSPAVEKIRRLADADRAVIESLQPYKGGNDLLYSLHHLDVMRKHQRLLGVDPKMRRFNLMRWGHNHAPPEYLFAGGPLKDGTPLCRIASGTDADLNLTVEVCFRETAFAKGRPVIFVLREFAAAVGDIIKRFDNP